MKSKLVKKLVVSALTAVMCLGSSISSFAASGSWKQDSTGWWYSYTNGGYPKKQWAQIDKVWYYFSEDGYMAANEYREGYWLEGSGACSSKYVGGTWKTNSTGKWYEDKTGYYPVKTWLKIDGSYYYFDESGYAATDKWVDGYYLDKDGKWIEGAKFVDYSGTYVDNFAGRGVVKVTNTYDSYYSFVITWPSSASVSNEWKFIGKIDYNGVINYTGCTKVSNEFDGKGGSTTKTVYSDGTGTIKIKGDQLTWDDKKEDVAKGNVFIKSEEIEETDKSYAGEYAEVKTHRASIKVEAANNGFYNITISVPDENGNADIYTLSGTFDKNGKLTYTNAVKKHETYDTKGNTVSKQVFKRGSGTITITGKKAKWVNNNEDITDTDFEMY